MNTGGTKLHMNKPIWVWVYDYGPATRPESWTKHLKRFGWLPKAYPQAHTYAFLTEEEAENYARDHWPVKHGYILQKTYLQERAE